MDYIWDASIGDFGGFKYKNNSIIIKKPPKFYKIKKCEKCNVFSSKYEVQGLNKTNYDLIVVPKYTDYGWDTSNKCWVYFTDNSDDLPTHYLKYNP